MKNFTSVTDHSKRSYVGSATLNFKKQSGKWFGKLRAMNSYASLSFRKNNTPSIPVESVLAEALPNDPYLPQNLLTGTITPRSKKEVYPFPSYPSGFQSQTCDQIYPTPRPNIRRDMNSIPFETFTPSSATRSTTPGSMNMSPNSPSVWNRDRLGRRSSCSMEFGHRKSLVVEPELLRFRSLPVPLHSLAVNPSVSSSKALIMGFSTDRPSCFRASEGLVSSDHAPVPKVKSTKEEASPSDPVQFGYALDKALIAHLDERSEISREKEEMSYWSSDSSSEESESEEDDEDGFETSSG